MDVARRVPDHDLAVRAAAEQDREFGVEGDEAFEDRGRAAHRLPGRVRLAGARRSAPGPCRHSRSAGSSGSPARRSRPAPRPGSARSSTAANGAGRPPRSATKLFSLSRSWAISSAVARRIERRLGGERGERRRRRYSRTRRWRRRPRRPKRAQRRLVVVSAAGEGGGDLGGRAAPRRARRHGICSRAGPPPSPASGRAGRRRRCRWSSRAGRSFGRFGDAVGLPLPPGLEPRRPAPRRRVARIAAASRPALAAPGLADRQRAHRHAGRHLDDREQAVEAGQRLGLSTGTPSTGSRVIDAAMPGRWAAPPAPAMITLRPRAGGAPGIIVEPLGRAVGGDDLASHRPRRARRASRRHGASSPSRSGCP